MFTDTKNLANANSILDLTIQQTNSSSCCGSSKSKGKLKKVWKPLIRLISLKTTTSKKVDDSQKHPNNVHLNNAQTYSKVSGEQFSRTQAKDEESLIYKVALPPKNHYEQVQTITARSKDESHACSEKNISSIISCVSIEKTPTSACHGCTYGRNCQHDHIDEPCLARLPVIELPCSDDNELNNLPVHYISTDDGTFFWTSAQNKSDDDLLNAWLCNSFRQFPIQMAVSPVLH